MQVRIVSGCATGGVLGLRGKRRTPLATTCTCVLDNVMAL